ncbi:antibiotic biosynthesis monooxygenase family protein [Frigidibacter sp. MR17.14]|uniref:antibiotic biosynthesis monooxygenase family protein n=1 Tax=Frigidibacter sp. MR17.14 TaxID=3126509 RepID=UPI003012B5AA
MTVEILRYAIPAAEAEAFIADYRAAMVPLMASPHARAFELCQCDEEPGRFLLCIDWTSAEDHLQQFRGSAEFRAFFAHIRRWVPQIEEMRHYTRRLSA